MTQGVIREQLKKVAYCLVIATAFILKKNLPATDPIHLLQSAIHMDRINSWLLLHSLCIQAILTSYLLRGTFHGNLLGIVVACSFAGLTAVTSAHWRNGYLLGGPANWITWLRLGLCLLLLYSWPAAPVWQLAVIGLLEISLDAIDGALARRYQTQSAYGACFDGEVDAFFVLVMSILLYRHGYAGPWIIGLGLLRYVYYFPNQLLKGKGETPKSRSYARIIAGIVMVGLPVALIAPAWLYSWALPALGLLLFYSFNRELWERALTYFRIP